MLQAPTIVLAFFAVFAGAFLPVLAQEAVREYQVKAAFLFNFAKFVEWPPPATGTFTICLAGDPFGSFLENTIRGENLQGRPLAVRRLAAADNARSCQMIFFSESEARTAQILAALGTAPVLTVGEHADFITDGGMIRFTENARRIQFEINPDAAERHSLKISSRLLRLASIVRPRPEDRRE
jgi:hypothetical protein